MYYILKDTPHILDNIKLLILESDFAEAEHKEFVEAMMAERGFSKVYSEPLPSHMVPSKGFPKCCIDSFYEVWKR